MEEDIRKNGKLYLHQKRFGKRWRKIWCVLVAEGRRSVARLELYENKQMSVKEGSSKTKPDYKQVIRLRECIRISENKMADCPKDCKTFFLETSDKLYVFAAPHAEAGEWIASLCEQAFPETLAEQRFPRKRDIFPDPARTQRQTQENSLYDSADSVRDFVVKAMGTEAAVRCSLYGEYVLSPKPDCLLLKDSVTKEVLLKWPYSYIRKFGQDMLSFSFEAGRRCESGEGSFEFVTNQGETLFNIVGAALKNLPSKTSAAKHSSHEDQSVREAASAEGLYEDIPASTKTPDCSPKTRMHKAVQHKALSNRSFSLNAIQPSGQSIKTSGENEEQVYAVVTKTQDPQKHRKNPKKALHQFEPSQDSFKTETDVSQTSGFMVSQEEELNGETLTRNDSTDLLSDSIHQLAINDNLSIKAEAIYADPEDFKPTATWGVSAVYNDPEEPIMASQNTHDGAAHPPEHDFLYSPDMPTTQFTAAQSGSTQSSDETFSNYDNLRLKGRRM